MRGKGLDPHRQGVLLFTRLMPAPEEGAWPPCQAAEGIPQALVRSKGCPALGVPIAPRSHLCFISPAAPS